MSYDEVVSSNIFKNLESDNEVFEYWQLNAYARPAVWTSGISGIPSPLRLQSTTNGNTGQTLVDLSKSFVSLKIGVGKKADGTQITDTLVGLTGSAYSLISQAVLKINGIQVESNQNPMMLNNILSLLHKSKKQLDSERSQTLFAPYRSTQGFQSSESGDMTSQASTLGYVAQMPPVTVAANIELRGIQKMPDSDDPIGFYSGGAYVEGASNAEFMKLCRRMQVPIQTAEYFNTANAVNPTSGVPEDGTWVQLKLTDMFSFARQAKILPVNTVSVELTINQQNPQYSWTHGLKAGNPVGGGGGAPAVGAAGEDAATIFCDAIYIQAEGVLKESKKARVMEQIAKGAKIPLAWEQYDILTQAWSSTGTNVNFSMNLPYSGKLKKVIIFPQNSVMLADQTRAHLLSGATAELGPNQIKILGKSFPDSPQQGVLYGYAQELGALREMSSIPEDESWLTLQNTFLGTPYAPGAAAAPICKMYPILCYDVSKISEASAAVSLNSAVLQATLTWLKNPIVQGGGATMNYYIIFSYEKSGTLDPITNGAVSVS